MIVKTDNQDIYSAKEIRYVFQLSYKIEAELLNAIDFPPLKRTLEEFIKSNNTFYCYYEEDVVAGVIEVDSNDKSTHIQSLVVHPDYFRKGIGEKLVKFVLKTYKSQIFTVETGLKNIPATNLYKKLGFQKKKQWDTEHGVRKISFLR